MQLGPGLTPGQARQLWVKEMEQMAGFSTGRVPGKCLGPLTPERHQESITKKQPLAELIPPHD